MKRHGFAFLALLSLGISYPAAIFAQVTNEGTDWAYSADELDSEFNHTEGEVVTRLGFDITAVAGLSDGEVSTPDSINVGLTAGVGYFVDEQVSTDIDATASLIFSDNSDQDTLNALAVVPGAHVYPVPQAFVHLGFPIMVHPTTTVSLLGGLGYEIPMSDSQVLVGEVMITYPLSEEGDGVITLGGGTAISF